MGSLNLERPSKSRLPYAQQMSNPQQCSPSLNVWNFVFLGLLLNIIAMKNGGLNSLVTLTDAFLLPHPKWHLFRFQPILSDKILLTYGYLPA